MHINKILIVLLFTGMVSSTFIQLNDTNGGNAGDTYADSANANTNYGTATTMKVGTAATYQTSYIAFYLGGLSYPSNAQILDAELWVWKADTTGISTTLNCLNTSYFDETTLTWNNKPAAITLQQAVASGTVDGAWIPFNVTNGTQAALYNANRTVYLTLNTSGLAWDFYTKNNADTAHRPQLNVTYTSGQLKPSSGLAGYWMLDDDSGTSAFDSSGNGNIGTIYNSPTWTTGRNYQTPYALQFTGSQYVQTINNINITGSSNRTICAWANPTTATPNTVVAGWGTQVANTQFYLASDGVGGWNIGWYGSATSFGSVSANAWNYICATYNGTDILTYQNGVYETTTTVALTTATTPLNIGVWGDNSSTKFVGIIDEVKVWNRTLSGSEIMNESFYYCNLNSINIIAYNESNSAFITSSFVASNSTSTFSWTPTTASGFTDYSCNSTFPIGTTTVAVSNSTFYSPRYYYPTQTLGGNYILSAYLLPLSDQYAITTSFIILAGNSIVTNAYVTVQKQVAGSWTTIAQKYTDSAGAASFNLDYQTPYYIITSAAGYANRYDTITPTSTVYYLSLLGTSTSAPFWQYYGLYAAGCIVSNATYPAILITCSLNDSSGHLMSTYLSAVSVGTFGSTTLCSNTTTPNNTVSCFIASPQNKTIVYSLAAKTSSDPGYITVFSDILSYFTISNFSNYGIIPAFIFVFALGFAGVMLNPALGVVGAISGVWLSSIMQLVTISPAGLMGLTIVGVILVYMMR